MIGWFVFGWICGVASVVLAFWFAYMLHEHTAPVPHDSKVEGVVDLSMERRRRGRA